MGRGAYADPRNLLKALQGLSKRVGACVDTAIWTKEGIPIEDGLKTLNDRVIAVRLLDRSTRGKSGRNVTLGTGAARIADLLGGMARMGIAPAFVTVEYTGTGDVVADMSRSFDALDKALQPVAADRVDQLSKTTPIRGPERLRETDRLAIEAAVPAGPRLVPGSRGNFW